MLKIQKVEGEENSYELVGEEKDYHVRLEQSKDAALDGEWYIDIFRSGERDTARAHLRTETADSLEEALELIFDEEGLSNEC